MSFEHEGTIELKRQEALEERREVDRAIVLKAEMEALKNSSMQIAPQRRATITRPESPTPALRTRSGGNAPPVLAKPGSAAVAPPPAQRDPPKRTPQPVKAISEEERVKRIEKLETETKTRRDEVRNLLSLLLHSARSCVCVCVCY